MCRSWPSLSFLLILFSHQTFACVDVLFVIDNNTLEISRSRAIQVAKLLPEDQKIRKWVVLSREDRYVPRVLRNNAELLSVLSTIHGDYDRFLEVATGEISRRTATFQPFVILLFSETPVNQTLTNMWRSVSLAPALHIFRIGSLKRTNLVGGEPKIDDVSFSRMLSEDQETDFEKLILCGHNKTIPFGSHSSKFSGQRNDIRRAPTSTHRPLTSTRDPYVRRLTFYDASRTLLEEKKQQIVKPVVNTKYTITRTFKKMSTTTPRPITTTRRLTTLRTINGNKVDVKREPTTNKWRPTARTTTKKPETSTNWKESEFASLRRRLPIVEKMKKKKVTNEHLKLKRQPPTTTKKPFTTTRRWYIPYEGPNAKSGIHKSSNSNLNIRVTTTRRPEVTTRRTISSTTSRRTSVKNTTNRPKTTASWFVPYARKSSTRNSNRISSTTFSPQTTRKSTTARWFVPYNGRNSNSAPGVNQKWNSNRASTTQKPPTTISRPRTTARWYKPFENSRSSTRPFFSSKSRNSFPSTTYRPPTTIRKPQTTARWFVPYNGPNFRSSTKPPNYWNQNKATTKSRPTSKQDSSFWHPIQSFVPTTQSPPPAVTIDIPLKTQKEEMIEQLNGKDFMVRSNSVHFAMTEEPPVKSTMNFMRLFSTARPTTTPTRPQIPTFCTADVFFLVDLSEGTGDKSQQYLDIAASAISSLPISQDAVRVGLISYSGPGRTHVRVYLDKHNDKDKLIEEMFLMERHGGTTRTADAIRYATKIFEGAAHKARQNVKKVLVVFTDGYSRDNPKEAARVARAKGLQLVAVAVKDKAAPPDEQQLKDIGGHPTSVLISPNGRELRDKIIGAQCRI